MQAIFTIISGVILILLLLYSKCPYFVHDCMYICKVVQILKKKTEFRRQQPFYTLLDRFLDLVRYQPGKPFIIFENQVFTFLDADKQSNKVARALQDHVGLKEEDTAALFLGNQPCFVWLWLGLAKLGCAAAMLNYKIKSKSLLHCLMCSGAKVLIMAAELKDAVVEVLPSVQEQGVRVFILSEDCDTEGIESLSDKIQLASDQPLSPQLRAEVKGCSPTLFFYTSGTTGLPKASVTSQERAWAAAFLLSIAGVTHNDVIYINLPLYHSAAFQIGLHGAIERGITVVLRRKFSASQFWGDCKKYNVTVIQYIGEIMHYLCNTPKSAIDREHHVRIAIGNGMRTDVWKTFLKRFGNVRIKEFYAASDGNMSLMNYVGKIGAVGRVNLFHKRMFPYTLLKYDSEREELLRDANGLCIEVSRGETGLFVSKITNIAPFPGYLRNSEQTEKKKLKDVLEKGDVYLNSGDLLKIEKDGFIYFQDRVGDTFRWKGENVATCEVADLLIMMPCVAEANMYGVQVPGYEGRVGMAALTLKEGEHFDGTEMFIHANCYLPSYAQPHFIRIQSSVEMTGTFKQIKYKLVKEGFDPAGIQDTMFFLDRVKKMYVPLTQDIHDSIISGNIKL